MDDEHLLEFRHRFGAVPPVPDSEGARRNSGQELALTGEPTAHLAPIADALRLLQQLHRAPQLPAGRRHHRPPAGRNARARRLHPAAGRRAGAGQRAARRRARAPVRGERRHFVSRLHRRAAHGRRASEAAEAPILEEGSDGVRLMTVHKAKGLEFPVVILADLTCRMSRNDASRYLDASRGLCAMKIGGWAPHELHEHESRRGRARSGRGRAARVRRRDAGARSARRPGAWRRAVGGRLVQPAEPRALSADGDASSAPGAVRGARRSSRRTRCCSGRTTRPPAPRTVVPGAARRSPAKAAIRSSGGIRARRVSLGREADLRRPPRRSDRQGRAEECHRGRPRPVRPLASRARRCARRGSRAVDGRAVGEGLDAPMGERKSEVGKSED